MHGSEEAHTAHTLCDKEELHASRVQSSLNRNIERRQRKYTGMGGEVARGCRTAYQG